MDNAGQRHKRILVADDSPDTVLGMRLLLESEGYEVIEAYDGLQALEILKDVQPDLIVLDVMMPRLDGWTALAEIQDDERLKDIPVVLLTALRGPSSIRTGIDLGATWYYPKPITNYDDFCLVIRRILEGLEPPRGQVENW